MCMFVSKHQIAIVTKQQTSILKLLYRWVRYVKIECQGRAHACARAFEKVISMTSLHFSPGFWPADRQDRVEKFGDKPGDRILELVRDSGTETGRTGKTKPSYQAPVRVKPSRLKLFE